MVNQEKVSDKQIKDILVYINGLYYKKPIRMMFMCSILGGMRSINFRSLQVHDVYKPDGTVKETIDLKSDKNKGDRTAQYRVNQQLRKEFEEYYGYLKSRWKDRFSEDTYLFTSQKMNKPYNPRSIYRIFSSIYKKFYIHGGTHMGRHIYITKLINNGINPFIVQKLVNHRSVQTTQRYYQQDADLLQAAVNTLKF